MAEISAIRHDRGLIAMRVGDAVVADAGRTLQILTDALVARKKSGIKWLVRRPDEAQVNALDDGQPLTSVAALWAVRRAVPRDATVTVDAGGFRIWTLVSFPVYDAHSYVNPSSWATMGTGLPSAIGAAVADRNGEVVALTGDSGLMMYLHELHTFAAEGLDLA